MFGRVRTKGSRGHSPSKNPNEVFGKVRYGLNTLLNAPVRFGINLIPGPDTSVCSVCPPKHSKYPGYGYTLPQPIEKVFRTVAVYIDKDGIAVAT